MKIKFFLLALYSLLLFASCGNENNNTIRERGVIEQQGITSYQYGSHTFTNEENFYALKSDNIDLDQYVDQEVIIVGKLVHEGLSGGPRYYEVTKIEE